MTTFLNRIKAHPVLYGVVAVSFVTVLLFIIIPLWQHSSSVVQRCFVLEQNGIQTYVAIEDTSPNASITILERRDGKDIEPPSTGPGTLEDGAVVLVDGTRLVFDSTQLVWPEGSLLAGSVFVTTPCPSFK